MDQWITKCGPTGNEWPVNRVDVPHDTVPCDMTRPPAGVGHTTEGAWDGSMSVFHQHYAPNFMLGPGEDGKVKIVQFVPIGYMAAALVNLPGGGETNRWARAQFELVAHSSLNDWHAGEDTMRALGALLHTLEKIAGIPLHRPFADSLKPGVTWATASNPRRQSGKWGHEAGWYNHLEVPENDHWDMGAFQWSDAFAFAKPDRTLVGHRVTWTDTKGKEHHQDIGTGNSAINHWLGSHPHAAANGKVQIARRFK